MIPPAGEPGTSGAGDGDGPLGGSRLSAAEPADSTACVTTGPAGAGTCLVTEVTTLTTVSTGVGWGDGFGYGAGEGVGDGEPDGGGEDTPPEPPPEPPPTAPPADPDPDPVPPEEPGAGAVCRAGACPATRRPPGTDGANAGTTGSDAVVNV